MNLPQLHLALNYVPVILSVTGLMILVVALLKKKMVLTQTAFYLLLVAGLVAVPVFLAGKASEAVVHSLPGVSDGLVQRHEYFAGIAFKMIVGGGLFSMFGILLRSNKIFAGFIASTVFIFSLTSAVVMVKTAHLGEQIRHTEVRQEFIKDNAAANAAEPMIEVLPKED